MPVGYSGYNTNVVAINDWSNTSTVNALAQAAQSIGAQTLRLPGGDTANYWDWDIGSIIEKRFANTVPYFLPQELPLGLRFKRDLNATLENVKPLITGSGAEPIWVVNMTTSNLDKEIRHLLEAKSLGLSVKRIELGNELYFNLPNYTRNAKTAADYAAKAKEWALAIKATPGLEDTVIAITGVTNSLDTDRAQAWWPALLEKTGSDNLSAIDVVDAFTLHPYYGANELDLDLDDVGDRTRAGEIARDGIAELRSMLGADILHSAGLDNEDIWITEHNIIEDGSDIILGNSWLHALMMDLHTQEFLKDERTTISIAHVLTGNARWQALTGQDGSQVDGAQRGVVTDPTKSDPNNPFEPTATGLVLGKTAEVFDSGTASLLKSGDASIVWHVRDGNEDTISAVNADDRVETIELPAGQNWVVTTYTGDPWATVKTDSDLQVTTRTIAGGTTLTIPGFSKVIAKAV